MRKYGFLIVLLTLPLLFGFNATKIIGSQAGGGVTAAGSDCPAWGTYGTSTGNILFAWDGSHSSGQNYGCDEAEVGINGSENGDGLSGTGSDTVWSFNADNEYFSFSVDNPADDDAFTVCIELQMADPAGNDIVFEIVGDSNSYYAARVKGTDIVEHLNRDGVTSNSSTGGDALTVDDSTWNDLCLTFRVDDLNDAGIKVNANAYDEFDTDFTGWATEEVVTFTLGRNVVIGAQAIEHGIRRAVIIAGYAQTAPW